MPRWPEKPLDATEQDIGQKPAVEMPSSVKVADVKRSDKETESDIVIVGGDGLDDSYAAQLAFLEEFVDVMVHESTDANAEPVVHIAVSGVNQFFPRGAVVTCKRKFLCALASAKTSAISVKNIQTDTDVISRIDSHTALRYPFSVARDANPKGAAWLRSVLSAA